MKTSTLTTRILPLGLAGAVLAQTGAAQQFKHIPGSFPNPKKWTEGVECADVDQDGDLDVFFAEGSGFASAGAKEQNVLVINRLDLGPGTFQDESVARLGTHTSHARSVDTGDVDGDGWVDAMFANAFNTDPPFLYMNRGAAQPGFFDFEGAARGFTTAYSSANSNFGDLDNDGDLDVIILDSGNSYLGGSGDRPHLFFNDGNGFFTEDAVSMNAVIKKAHMDVQYVDIDNDWDLDFFGPTRASNPGGNHYLMLNDGSGAFTDASGLLPGTSSNVYEAEVGDLDGDQDMDMFFVSLSGFAEGSVVNNLNPSGTLSFSTGGTLSNQDDNEVALLDYDTDGDYDVIIGSLGTSEKLFENNGSGVFSTVASDFTVVGDSTLDVTVADMNNDGRYDVVSAQGESGSAQWDAKLYANTTGPLDIAQPVIVREENVASGAAGPWVVRSEIRDQVMDDGQHWVSAEVDYVVNTAPKTAAVTMPGLSFSPAVITVTAGTTVTWTNTSAGTMKHDVVSSTPGYDFSSGLFDPGQSYSYTFVRPGTYDYFCTPHQAFGMVGQVIVTADPASVNDEGFDMGGGGLIRFEMDSAVAGDLVYERRFTDYAGNVTVSPAVSVPVTVGGSSGSFTVYGTGAAPANYMSIAGSGSTSIGNAFQVDVTGITQPLVLLVVSLNQTSLPLFGGVMLSDFFSPLLPLQPIASVGGSGTWNGAIPNDPTFVGLGVYFQAGITDATQPGGFGMSDGLELIIGL